MATLGQLSQLAGAVAEDDRINLWDTSDTPGSRDKFINPSQLRGILTGTANTWTAAQTFNSNINVVGGIYLDNSKYIWVKDNGGTNRVVLYMTTSNHLDIGRQVQSGNRLDFSPGNAIRMTILADTGNVGIGTPSPSTPLHVYAAAGETYVLAEVASTAGAGFRAKNTNGDWLAYTTDGKWTLRNMIGQVNRFWIDASGNVGIGTPSPQARLDVQGGMYSTGALGWQYVKYGVPSGTSTGICSYTVSGGTGTSVLVSVSLTGTDRLGSQIWAVSTARFIEDVRQLSSVLYGYTDCTLLASMDTATRTCTLFVNQTNDDSEAAQVTITIQPIGYSGSDRTFSFNGY